MDYDKLNADMRALLSEEDEPVTTLANAAALLFERLPDVNWAGFYLFRMRYLRLGPFCGRPACVRIEPGKGVCGTAYSRHETVTVEDVHDFPGHIACDSVSMSEIVVPLHDKHGALIGVMDIDSPIKGRFTDMDAKGLEEAERIISACLCDFMRPIRNSVKAIIIRDKKLLVNRCEDTITGEIYYALPGGGQEKYETFDKAVIRECREELGITVIPKELVLIRDYIGREQSSPAIAEKHIDVHQMEYFFRCELIGDVDESRADCVDEEQRGYAWIPLNEFKDWNFYPAALKERITQNDRILGPLYMGSVE